MGEPFTVEVDVSLLENVTTAQIQYKVKAGILTLTHGTADLCTPHNITLPLGAGTVNIPGLKCPQAQGEEKILVQGQINKDPIKGKIHVELISVDQSGQQLFCVNVVAQKKKNDDEGEDEGEDDDACENV